MSVSSKPTPEALNKYLELGRFSSLALASLELPGFPTSEAGCAKVAKGGKWNFVDVQAKGGKKGIKREFIPPEPLQALIQRHLRGEVVTAEDVALARARRTLASPFEVVPAQATPAHPQSMAEPSPAAAAPALREDAPIIPYALGRQVETALMACGQRAPAVQVADMAADLYGRAFGQRINAGALAAIVDFVQEFGDGKTLDQWSAMAAQQYCKLLDQRLITATDNGPGLHGATA